MRPSYILIAGLSLGAVLTIALWPSRYSGIRNLASPGDTVVVLGDSIPAGFGVGIEAAWPTLTASALGLKLINASVSGETTAGGLARLQTDVLAHRPRLVIVELGGNDFLGKEAPSKTAANLESIFTQSQGAGAAVVFIGVQTPFADEFQHVFQSLCKAHGVYYIPNVLAGCVAHPDMMYDSIHPSAKGHRHIADRLIPELRGLLAAADKARR